MQEKLFWKLFARRSAVCFFVIIALFLSCILRIYVIATSDYSLVQQNQSSLKIKIANQRGTIYDRNMVPVTNNESKIIACISPTPRAVTAISTVLKGQELENILEKLKSGKPVTCEVPKEISCDGIVCTKIYTHNTSQTVASHTIGYIDTDFNGISGLEKAYNDILYSDQEVYIRYSCDGKGNILQGVPPEIINNNSVIACGVISTIDINIQNIVEEESDNIECGAVIVADCENSKIRAITSRPNFDLTNIKEYLDLSDSPLFNRTISAYNVGSAFKPCIAAAGIESGKSNFFHNCTGKFEIIDRTFKCHKADGHGFMDLSNAIANSCNTFFYNFAFKIGKESIYNTASNLNFGKQMKICDGIYTAKGSIPTKEKLDNIAHLANFSIGQGDFLASPVSMLNLYCAIANGGKYYIPSIVEATAKNGKITPYNIGNPTKVMSEKTAQKIIEGLSLVIEQGTGILAKPKTVSAAGKTATAQTGKFENGREILSSWFCGFFPKENPKYTVIVFCENSRRQTKECGEIFAQIADKITSLAVDK